MSAVSHHASMSRFIVRLRNLPAGRTILEGNFRARARGCRRAGGFGSVCAMPAADLPTVARALSHLDHTAIVVAEGTFAYRDLIEASERVAARLLNSRADLAEARVAFLAPAGWPYVATQWGIWRAGGVAVPPAPPHPPAELEHVIRDAEPEIVVAHPDFADTIRALGAVQGLRVIRTDEALAHTPHPARRTGVGVKEGRRAMIVYTSGTTGKPKGIVTTHANLRAQVTSLITAWEWTADDAILLVLPLHHVHGIVNVLTCALWAGARCEMLPKFDAARVWSRLADGDLTLFMAVPTIYTKLIAAWDAAPEEQQRAWSAGCARLRLMVSGSAALPVPTLERWRAISGHTLLERYGMTEFGMALSNPVRGECRPGFVGTPLPGVEARLVDEQGGAVAPGTLAELQAWARERLAPYKLPRALRYVAALPRNAMGKVMKPEVAALFGARSA